MLEAKSGGVTKAALVSRNAVLIAIVIGMALCIGGAVLYPPLSRNFSLGYIAGFILFCAVGPVGLSWPMLRKST